MAYTVHQAKTNFSRLLKEAEAGEEVIVMRVFDPLTDEQMIEYGFDNPEKDARLAAALSGRRLESSHTGVETAETAPPERAE
jgi:hypothetical protein